MQGPEGTRWFVYDGLGSTRALMDDAGTLTDEYTYEAFGSLIHRTGVTANEFLFTGEQWEPRIGYYLRARYYDPTSGRFTAVDPLISLRFFDLKSNLQLFGLDTSLPSCISLYLHQYLYCSNDPVNIIDLSGLYTLIELNESLHEEAIIRQAELSRVPIRGLTKVHGEIGHWVKILRQV